MTSPGGDVVGRQYVEIWPTLRRWASELRTGVAQANAETRRQLAPIERQVEEHHRHILSSTLGLVGRTSKAIVVAGSAAATAAGAIGLKAAASTETATTAFSQLLGGVKQSQKFMGDLARFAAATPFEMPGLIDASRQLLGAGAAAKSVIPTLTAWGNAAGSLGIQQEDFNGIMLAVTQTMNKQKVQNEELMQITERGIPVYPLLAKAMGKPVAEIQKMASEGKLLSKDTLPLLEKQLNKNYGGGLIKQSQTLLGLWSTFKDTFTQGMSAAIMPALPMIKNVLAGATSDLQDFFTGIQGGTDKTRTAFTTAGYGIRAFFTAVKEGDVTSDGFVGRMERAGSAVHAFYGGLQGRGELQHFSGWANTAGLGLRALVEAFKDGDVTSDGFVGAMEKIGVTARATFDYVKNTAIPNVRDWIAEFRNGGGDMAKSRDAIKDMGVSFQELTPAMVDFKNEMPSLADTLTVTSTLMGFLADHIDTVRQLLPFLVAGLIAWKLSQIAANIAMAASMPLKVAEVIVNRQLVKSNMELVASRKAVTTATVNDTAARSTNIFAGSIERLKNGVLRLAGVAGPAKAATDGIGGSMRKVAQPAERAATGVGRAGSALSRLGGATFGAVGAAIGGLGPLGLALTGAGIVAGIFAARKREAKQRVDEFTDAINKDTGALGTNVQALAAQRLEQSGALKAANDLGLSVNTVTQAALGNAQAQRIVSEVMHDRTTVSAASAQAMDYDAVQLAKNRGAAAVLDGALGDLTGQIRSAKESADRQAAAVGGSTTALGANTTAANVASSAIGGLNAKLAAHIQHATDATRSEYDFRDSLNAMTTSVQANGRSLDVNTTAGRNNRRAILDAMDAAKRHADAVFDQTHDQGKSTKAFWDSIPAIKEQARRLGLNKKQVDDLITSIAGLKPKTVPVTAVVTASGRVTAPNGVVIVPGRASGGPVPGFSTSATSDNQLIAATPGEWVIKRPTVDKVERQVPGFMNAFNEGRVSIGGDKGAMRVMISRNQEHVPTGFADGGLIGSTQSFIRSTDRLPYVWGAAGPGAYDCSGLVGAVYGKLTGRGGGGGQRYFTTSTVGQAQGFRPGNGTFSIGVTSGMGHMVGNLAGLKFEARSTDTGIFTGAAAQSVKNFPRQMFLPQFGGTFGENAGVTLNSAQQMKLLQQIMPQIVRDIVRELGVKRDTGGNLLPGQIAVNEAGGRERVLSASQNLQYEAGQVTPATLRAALDGITVLLRDPLGQIVAGQFVAAGQRGSR